MNDQERLEKLKALAKDNANPHEAAVATTRAKELEDRLAAERVPQKQTKKELPKGISIRNGSFVAYVTVNGEPVRKVVGQVGCITPKQAAQERTNLLRDIRDGKYPPAPAPKPEVVPEPNAIIITELWNAYLADCTNREKRVDRLKTAWTHLEPAFGKRAAATIRTKDIEEYTTQRRAEKRLNGTINRELSVLKALMRHAARSGEIERVPMFPKRLPESKPRQGFIEEAQYKTLVINASDLWLRTFVALGFNYGFRKSEMLNLRVRDVELLEGDWLTIVDSKNGDSRKVALTQETKALLAACMRGKEKVDFILTRKDGSRVAQPRKDWYNLCVASGFGKLDEDGGYEGLQMHDLRRSAVRRLVRCGVPEKVCMAISGHKTRSVFDRYNITNERDLEQAARQIELGGKVSVAVSDEENLHKTYTPNFAHS
jgi:integrase